MNISVPYNYDWITEQRTKKKPMAWTAIDGHYNRVYPNAMRWYKRQTRHKFPNKTKPLPEKKQPRIKPGMKLPAYGKLPPTGYKADIQNIDDLMNWIKEHTPYKWDTKPRRQQAEYLFFNIFKKGQSGMVGAPRDSGKSKVSVAVYACIFANYHHTQMSIVNGNKGKLRIFRGMTRILYSAKFRRKYGDIVQSKNKMTGEIEIVEAMLENHEEISDDPTFIVTSVFGIIGAHPYVVWLEDIMQSEAKDELVNDYMIEEVHNAVIMKLSNRRGGTFTRKGLTDLYSRLPYLGYMMFVTKALEIIKGTYPDKSHIIYEDRQIGETKQRIPVGCRVPEGSEFKMIDRPGWTLSWLLLQRVLDVAMFEREMNCNPMPQTGIYFDKNEWNKYSHSTLDKNVYPRYTACDPSSGLSASADFSAILNAEIRNGKLHVFSGLKERLRLDELQTHIFNYNKVLKPLTIWLEKLFQQNWIHQGLETLANLMPFMDTRKGAKYMRIEAMKPYFAKGLIVVNEEDPIHDILYEEYLSYESGKPSNASYKIDALDTLSMLVTKLSDKLYLEAPQSSVKWVSV